MDGVPVSPPLGSGTSVLDRVGRRGTPVRVVLPVRFDDGTAVYYEGWVHDVGEDFFVLAHRGTGVEVIIRPALVSSIEVHATAPDYWGDPPAYLAGVAL